MSRLAIWKRRRLDAILSSPRRLWATRAVLLALLVAAGLEAWFARTKMVGRIEGSGKELKRLVELEDSLEALRVSASTGRLDTAREAAFRGVFRDWNALADWLESTRSRALAEGWALEWQLAEPAGTRAYPDVAAQEVRFHVSLPEADFPALRDFLRRSVGSDSIRASLVRMQAIGDKSGVSELQWTVLVWVRTGNV